MVWLNQTSFASGELSENVACRVDLQKYSAGAKKLYNVFVHPAGGASNRPGTQFIAKTKDESKKSRLIPFQFSEIQAYVLEFGDKYIRIYKDGGVIVENGEPVEVVTVYGEKDLESIKYTQSADVIYLCHPNYPPYTLTRRSHTEWIFTKFEFKNGPFLDYNVTDTTLQLDGDTLTAAADLFQDKHVGSLWKLEHFMPAETKKGVPGVTADMEITAYESWRMETSGYWRGSFAVEKLDDKTDEWITIRTFSSSKDRNFSVTEVLEPKEATRIRVRNIDFVQLSSEGEFYGQVVLESTAAPYWGIVKVKEVTDDRTALVSIETPVGLETATRDWAEGAWSDVRGYPSCLTIHAQRLIFANTRHEPDTIWFSKASGYNDFGVSLSSQDDDAITRTIASKQVNGIRHIVSMNDIILLTSSSEWKVSPGQQESLITPTSFQARPQGYRGCSNVIPAVVGSRILYVQEMGATVRDMGYSFETDGFVSSEVNLLARHLFYKKTIVDWTYQQEPDSIVWAVRNDGRLLGFTYLKEQDVWAWHQHETDGQFESVCSIPGVGYNEVWFIVRRDGGRFVEKMAERIPSTKPEDQFFVDCGLSYNGDKTDELSGLEHLEGKEVVVLGDGNVLPKLIVSDGRIRLPVEVSAAHAGLPYTAEIQTLRAEFQSKDGSVQGRIKTIPRAVIRVENTRGVWIGAGNDLAEEYKQRAAEYFDSPIDLFTGDIEMLVPGAHDKNGQITIRQEDPLPMTVLSIIQEVVLGG